MSTPHPGTELVGCIWWRGEARREMDFIPQRSLRKTNCKTFRSQAQESLKIFFGSLLGGFLGMQEFGGAKSCRMHRSLLNTNIHWVRTMDGWMWGSMSSEVEFKLISFRLASIGGMIWKKNRSIFGEEVVLKFNTSKKYETVNVFRTCWGSLRSHLLYVLHYKIHQV